MYNTPVVADSLNQLTYATCYKLIKDGGIKTSSRNGDTIEMCDVELFLKNPRNRHLNLHGRTNNLYAGFAETIWVMAGEDKLDPLMNFMLPRAKNYSDDGGITWRAAYGNRLYSHGALESAVQSFLTDGKLTRQSVIAVHHADKDTNQSIKEVYGLDKTLDKPCNNFIWLWIRDNKLNMKVGVRSNDVIFGLSAINVLEWTVLQESILIVLRKSDEQFKDIELGYFHQSVISLHLYDATITQAINLLQSKENTASSLEPLPNYNIKLGNIDSIKDMNRFYSDIYNVLCSIITYNEYGVRDTHDIDMVFSDWGISPKENQLYNYAKLVEGYIHSKVGNPKSFDLDILSPDLKKAVLNNKFTPAEWL